MSTGLLWFDNDPNTSLSQKIAKAAAYYQKKYGRAPELCLVNPSMLAGKQPPDIEGITVRMYRPVLPGHLWIGFEDMPTEPKPESEMAK
jgi:hypothetical protein